jgi:hypothetical protein
VERGGISVSPTAVRTLVIVIALPLTIALMIPAVRYKIGDGVRALGKAMRIARTTPLHAIVWCTVLSVVSLVARVGVLPVLAAPRSEASVGVLALVSFLLIHGQIAIPTPAGAGPIELAFLTGVAGISTGAGAVLGWWRLYTTVLPIVAGFVLAAAVFGRGIVRRLPLPLYQRRENPDAS